MSSRKMLKKILAAEGLGERRRGKAAALANVRDSRDFNGRMMELAGSTQKALRDSIRAQQLSAAEDLKRGIERDLKAYFSSISTLRPIDYRWEMVPGSLAVRFKTETPDLRSTHIGAYLSVDLSWTRAPSSWGTFEDDREFSLREGPLADDVGYKDLTALIPHMGAGPSTWKIRNKPLLKDADGNQHGVVSIKDLLFFNYSLDS